MNDSLRLSSEVLQFLTQDSTSLFCCRNLVALTKRPKLTHEPWFFTSVLLCPVEHAITSLWQLSPRRCLKSGRG